MILLIGVECTWNKHFTTFENIKTDKISGCVFLVFWYEYVLVDRGFCFILMSFQAARWEYYLL